MFYCILCSFYGSKIIQKSHNIRDNELQFVCLAQISSWFFQVYRSIYMHIYRYFCIHTTREAFFYLRGCSRSWVWWRGVSAQHTHLSCAYLRAPAGSLKSTHVMSCMLQVHWSAALTGNVFFMLRFIKSSPTCFCASSFVRFPFFCCVFSSNFID